MRSHRIALLAIMSLTACATGKNAAELEIARSPAGATLRLTLTGKRKLEGELLELRDNGAVMFLRDGRVALVTWTATSQALAPELDGRYIYGLNMPPRADVKANLILVSHFPQGMTPDIEARYLASKGQKELVIIR
jgi:hypothetical protein